MALRIDKRGIVRDCLLTSAKSVLPGNGDNKTSLSFVIAVENALASVRLAVFFRLAVFLPHGETVRYIKPEQSPVLTGYLPPVQT